MSNLDPYRIGHILDAIEKIFAIMQGKGVDDLYKYFQISDVVEREIEVAGEAVSKMTAKFKSSHPEIPWREISDLRNRVIHNYDGLDYDTIYRVITKEIPMIKENLLKMGFPEGKKPLMLPKETAKKIDLMPKNRYRGPGSRKL